MEKVKPALQLEDEIRLHERGWILQRIGWAIMFLILISASLGLFGTGILSTQSITDKDTILKFERFARFETTMVLSIEAKASDGSIIISLPQTYIEKIEVQRIIPSPSKQEIKNNENHYFFEAKDNGLIKFYLTPEKVGKLNSQITVNDSHFSIHHFIYP